MRSLNMMRSVSLILSWSSLIGSLKVLVFSTTVVRVIWLLLWYHSWYVCRLAMFESKRAYYRVEVQGGGVKTQL